MSVGCRVLRGGAWNNTTNNLRCANRNNNTPDNENNNIGFRVVRAPVCQNLGMGIPRARAGESRSVPAIRATVFKDNPAQEGLVGFPKSTPAPICGAWMLCRPFRALKHIGT